MHDEYVALSGDEVVAGALTQKPGTAGCISETGTAGACSDGTALDDPRSVAISPDGTSAYVASQSSDAVAIFDRDTPPQTTIDTGPTETTNDNTPTFTFSASEAGSSFECKLDGGAFGACSGPGASHTATELSDGGHSFEVRATDPSANVDDTPASRAFSVDTEVSGARLRVKGRSQQKGNVLIVKCKAGAAEAVTITAKAKAKLDPGSAGAATRLKAVKLKAKPAEAAAGQLAKLKLKASREDSAQILEALDKGATATAKLKVTLIDAAGNSILLKKKVKLV